MKRKNKRNEDLLRSQTRIVTCLSFRHLLERLPPLPRDGSQPSNTQRWKAFWNQAAENAASFEKCPVAVDPEKHPLAALFQAYRNDLGAMEGIVLAGRKMYSTLSDQIHRYQGDFRVDEEHWKHFPYAVLQAIKPVNIDSEDNVDWGKEYGRYQGKFNPDALHRT